MDGRGPDKSNALGVKTCEARHRVVWMWIEALAEAKSKGIIPTLLARVETVRLLHTYYTLVGGYGAVRSGGSPRAGDGWTNLWAIR